jgi:hypothetical protein
MRTPEEISAALEAQTPEQRAAYLAHIARVAAAPDTKGVIAEVKRQRAEEEEKAEMAGLEHILHLTACDSTTIEMHRAELVSYYIWLDSPGIVDEGRANGLMKHITDRFEEAERARAKKNRKPSASEHVMQHVVGIGAAGLAVGLVYLAAQSHEGGQTILLLLFAAPFAYQGSQYLKWLGK